MDARLTCCEHEVVFELPTRGAATTLYNCLHPVRTTWQLAVDGIWAVGTELEEGNDLAVLLREVERWVAIQGVRALRYWVDGRAYVLESGDVPWPALALSL